ncbi:MAG TPA: hypothetical protein VL443_23570 [Cyclobacteriaceae bacterium]|jgi:hypothetical protein|nr:hypothetical protein [Cyclobacteriaceae bacterium]
MSYSLISILAILFNISVSNTKDSDFALPKTWTKDFTISLSYTGSMDGSSTHIMFTYDSCMYTRNSGMHAAEKDRVRLTESDRNEILTHLRELKVDKINSEMNIAPVNDGWSTSMCFGLHCIEGGTSARMSDRDKELFLNAYNYLEMYAVKKVQK